MDLAFGFWTPPDPFSMILSRFRINFCINFTGRQERPRTSKEPRKQRTPQDMVLQIAIRRMPSTASKRIPRNGTCPKRGAAVSRNMAHSIILNMGEWYVEEAQQ
jgi:hypothetical protein